MKLQSTRSNLLTWVPGANPEPQAGNASTLRTKPSPQLYHFLAAVERDHRDLVPSVLVPSLVFTFLVFGAERLSSSFPGLKLSSQVTLQMPPKAKVMGPLVAAGSKPFALKRSHTAKSWSEQANPYLIQEKNYHRQIQYFQSTWPRLKHEKSSSAGSGPFWICELSWRPPQSHQAIEKWSWAAIVTTAKDKLDLNLS